MSRFRHHIFVCTNTRPAGGPRDSCDPSGHGALRERFVEALQRRQLTATVRANSAGCLGACEHGPVVVVYPEGVWYGNVKLEDVDEIVESHIVGGRVVKRLLIPSSGDEPEGT